MLSNKLGKLAPKTTKKTLKFSNYVKDLPAPPASIDWESKVTTPWPMDKNDTVGDCTIAGAAHLIQLWSSYDKEAPVILTDDQVIAAYSAVTGIEGAAYDPATGANDNGCAESDVLSYWQKTGIGGQKIHAYAYVSPSNTDHVKIASDYFGGLYLGIQVLAFVEQLETPGSTWDVSDTNTSIEGGHCIPLVAYDADKITFISWGAVYYMTWAFFNKYCDESWAVLSRREWAQDGRKSPSGFNLAQLDADLLQLSDPVPAGS